MDHVELFHNLVNLARSTESLLKTKLIFWLHVRRHGEFPTTSSKPRWQESTKAKSKLRFQKATTIGFD